MRTRVITRERAEHLRDLWRRRQKFNHPPLDGRYWRDWDLIFAAGYATFREILYHNYYAHVIYAGEVAANQWKTRKWQEFHEWQAAQIPAPFLVVDVLPNEV